MARKIVVTSGKGGVGKTTVTACLGASLARRGQRVLLCDADFGLNNIDIVTGVENLVVYDIVDVIEGRCRSKQALVHHAEVSNLYILTSSHSAPERYVSPQSLKLVIDELSPQFDFILIDCPAGIDEGFHRAVSCADEAIVVVTPQISAIRDADKVVTLLKSYALQSVELIVNKLRGDLLAVGEGFSPVDVSNLLKIPLLGVLPETFGLYKNAFSISHPSFKLLANALLGKKRKVYDVTREYRGVVGAIKRTLKRKL